MELSDMKRKKGKQEELPRVVVKSAADLQRLKLEKLMKNPDKPIIIPERPKDRNMPNAPDFVRNVMGSSAGAGSGEFHVYRHLRRKEYARQKYIQEKSKKEQLDEEFQQKLEDNKRLADEKTAKKRAKRLKKKAKSKGKKPKVENKQNAEQSESESENEEGSDNSQMEESNIDSKVDDKNSENDDTNTKTDDKKEQKDTETDDEKEQKDAEHDD